MKNTDDSGYADQAWTFKHPEFHAGKPEGLENIKRKVPTTRKASGVSAPPATPSGSRARTVSTPDSPNIDGISDSRVNSLEQQVSRLVKMVDQHQKALEQHERVARDMHATHERMVTQLLESQRRTAEQDAKIQELLSWCANSAAADGGTPYKN